jgi:hypothetical protein
LLRCNIKQVAIFYWIFIQLQQLVTSFCHMTMVLRATAATPLCDWQAGGIRQSGQGVQGLPALKQTRPAGTLIFHIS